MKRCHEHIARSDSVTVKITARTRAQGTIAKIASDTTGMS